MISWFTRHPTASNLLLVLLTAIGIASAPALKRETFPDFRPTEAEISVIYRGASASEVENTICRRIWDAVEAVEDLEELSCRAQDNNARAVATMREAGTPDRFINDLRTEVSAIDDFPEESEPPTVRHLHRTDTVTTVAIAGDLPLSALDRYANHLEARLSALPNVATIAISGLGERQFEITVPRALLEQHGLSAADLRARVKAQSLDLPLGTIETPGLDIGLRLKDERSTTTSLAEIVIISKPNGAELRLGDIAQISERYSPEEEQAFYDGQRAIFLHINKNLGADALRVFDAVQELVRVEAQTLPPSLTLTIVQDMTTIIRERLAMLVKNGVIGIVLVIAVMSLFFHPAYAIWAALGLPVAFLGAFAVMAMTGLSLNMITLVALLMAIGIVMDDSIVISDAIAEEPRTAGTAMTRAIRGTQKVLPGVLSSFLTTVAVFAPLSFLAGDLGAVLEVLPIVLIAALAASLIEAFFVLPHHLAHGLNAAAKPSSRFRATFEHGFNTLRNRGLGTLVDAAIAKRYLVMGLTMSAVLLTVGLMRGGYVQREALPDIDGDVLEARILMPQGTPLSETRIVVDHVTRALKTVNRDLAKDQPDRQPLVQSTQILYNRNISAGEKGPHVATISVDLLDAETRNTPLDALISAWHAKIGAVPGALAITIAEPGFGPQGRALEIRLAGDDLSELEAAANHLLQEMTSYAGVYNALHDLRRGRPERKITLAEGATNLGLTSQEIASQISTAFLGTVIDTVQTGDISHEIELRQSDPDRDSLEDLSNFGIRLPDGRHAALSTLAHIEESRSWASITHVDGQRTLTLAADVDGRIGNADAIVSALSETALPRLAADFPGVTFEIGGQNANSAETVGSILRGFLIGLVGIYIVLSFQFRSYIEPVIVMFTIPLALIGVVLGHLIMGYNISMPSIMGAASLAGIVVNNAILLIQVIQRHVQEGVRTTEAAGRASRERFRPIVVSLSTTLMGMVPLLLETSTQAQTVKPLVISVVFGLFSATVLVLLVLPAFYAILDDLGLSRKSD
ncbi:efflux RND transporter permease subunit [Shimia sp. FJ5]|uniref:efflux RND transporter permease subunit n=1 Tax=Shimia sp. FJ5 TaxID=3079054 RepID=UPI002638B5D9|nr:efflux RND transporter permease subunit [Shimia sp. FJ5]MDV4146086.1 efflux RND transporter permease subunit [Shimia sp. FJ5]